jgi:tetratricopeptide (TPR) repeat protein
MISPEAMKKLFDEAVKHLRGDDFDMAIEKFETVFKNDRANIDAGYYLAVACANARDWNKALPLFEEIIDRLADPLRRIQCRFLMGYIYAVREMFELAEIELNEVLKTGGAGAQVLAALGYVHHRRKNYAAAATCLTQALAIDPRNANAHNSLGFVLAEAGMDIDEAIRHIRTALDLDNDNAAYFDSLGWAYYKKNDLVNARRYLMKAFELAPFEDEIKEHLRVVRQVSF